MMSAESLKVMGDTWRVHLFTFSGCVFIWSVQVSPHEFLCKSIVGSNDNATKVRMASRRVRLTPLETFIPKCDRGQPTKFTTGWLCGGSDL